MEIENDQIQIAQRIISIEIIGTVILFRPTKWMDK